MCINWFPAHAVANYINLLLRDNNLHIFMIGFFSQIEQINLKYCRSRPIFKKKKTTKTIKNTKQVGTIFTRKLS